MAKVKLGGKEFDADCQEIDANSCGVTDAECVAFGMRMKGGEFKRLTKVYLVSWLGWGMCWLFLGAESLQVNNQIGDAGACSIGEGLKSNSSVQVLYLVSCGG